MDELTLGGEFPAADREQWRTLVEGVLKGADFERRLVSRSYDGLRIEPLYGKAEGAEASLPPSARPWRIVQRMDHPDPAQANALALADLEGGANGLSLIFDGAPVGRGFGVRIHNVDDLERVLDGILLDLVHLKIETAPFMGRAAGAVIAALVSRRGTDPAGLSIDFGLDPIGTIARAGMAPLPWPDLAQRGVDMTRHLREAGFTARLWRVDSRPYHEAGAAEAQELAAALSSGLAYLRALEAAGLDLDAARDALSFLLVADADEFLTVAKFRALRRLWKRVEEGCGLVPKQILLEAETAWRMTTRRDPWVNLLRTTLAAFSAGIGGADAITVLPFTSALGLPDGFARRLARNTQLILLDESHLWRVADPTAGAGGFESLTETLCRTAWALFQEIEREGGILASLTAGTLQGRIAMVRAAREKAIATRKDAITGTSEFPNIREEIVTTLIPAPTQPAGGGEAPGPTAAHATHATPPRISFDSLVEAARNGAPVPRLFVTPGPPAHAVAPLPSIRSAEPFERLRDRADSYLARTGSRPRVFLANLGPIAEFTARATFVKNAFEAAGIEAVSGDGYCDNETLVRAYLDSNAKLACICSSDEIYKEQAILSAAALRNVSQSTIYLAGRPGDLEESLRRAGITTFIFAGCDMLEVLGQALDAACA
jgi:methylmalonyl-CoA mutase